MAEVTAFRNNALPYPVYGVPYVIEFPILDADGVGITSAAGLDSEIIKNGDTLTDCTNEAIEIGGGWYYLVLTAANMTADSVSIEVRSSSTGAQTVRMKLAPRKLVSLRTGTAQGGAAGYITLDASAGAKDDIWNGCLCVATIDSNVEARVISDYTGSSQQAAVSPSWNVTPDSDDTFVIYLPEGRQINEANVTTVLSAAATSADINSRFDDVDAATADIQSRIPDALTNGNIKAHAQSVQANALNASALATDAVTELQSGLATAAQISSLQVNTRANIQVPIEIEIPDASTQVWKIRLFLFDADGNMEAPDSTPTIALTNAAGTDRSSRLSSATVLSTGAYSWDYTSTAGDAEEQLVWVFTVVEGGLTRIYPATSYVVEETAYRFSSTDRSTLNAAATAAALATVSGKIDTIDGIVDTLLADLINGGRLDLILDAILADATLARQILGNKHTVVESPTGTFTISVRNDADDATVRTIVYVAATGARTVS